MESTPPAMTLSAAIDVHGYRASRVVGFLHGCPDFFQRIVVVAVVGDELDQIGAVKDILADRLSDLIGAIRVVVFEQPLRASLGCDARALASKRCIGPLDIRIQCRPAILRESTIEATS